MKPQTHHHRILHVRGFSKSWCRPAQISGWFTAKKSFKYVILSRAWNVDPYREKPYSKRWFLAPTVVVLYDELITHMLVWFLFASIVIPGYPLMSSEAQKTEVGPADAKALAFSGKTDTIWSWQLGKMMIHYVMMGHSILGDKPRCVYHWLFQLDCISTLGDGKNPSIFVWKNGEWVCLDSHYETGWWFGAFFIFPNSWDDDPIWLSYFSDGWLNHQPGDIVPQARNTMVWQHL